MHGAVQLHGRGAAVRLVREFLTREERKGTLHSRRYPVVVFTGPRGIGKTALLTDLARQLDQQVPYALVDCEGFDGGARELLTLLAFELNAHCSRYGTLSFPRLITGQIAIAACLDTTEREIARDQVRRVLEEHQKAGELLTAALGDMIQAGVKAVGGAHGLGPGASVAVGELSKYGPGLVLGALARSRRGRRLVLGRGQDWYGHQDRGLDRNPLDELVSLNRMAACPGAEDNKREVAELLWAAFLADLKDSFLHSRRASGWMLNCAVLLDNADTVVGHALLNELVTARSHRAAHAPDAADPLTVVATSRGSLAERVRPRGEGIAALVDAGYPDYLRRCRTNVGTWWYPVMLPSLTRDETGNMVAALGLPGTRHAVTSVVHRFTRGHPGSTRVLLDAVAEHRGGPADLPAILEGPEPGVLAAPRRTAEENLLGRFIRGLSCEAADDLVTCAAACHKEEALRLAADSGLLIQPWGGDSVIFAAELWGVRGVRAAGAGGGVAVGDPAGGGGDPFADGRAELHPVLRRLLSRRLSTRADGERPGWDLVHRWLRASSQEAGHENEELYHALALGEIEHVARHFAQSLVDAEVAGWLRDLRAVTVAPNRLDHRREPATQIRALTVWADQRELPLAAIGRLICAQWIDADPLSTGHRQRLRRAMAADLEQIAPCSTDLAAMRDEAERYRDDATGDD